MRIALYSPNFYPLTGGLEHMVAYMAQAFAERGHEVVVICQTPANGSGNAFAFRVLRRAGFWREWRALRWAEVVLMFNVSLKALPVVLLSGRPLVVSHQTPHTPDRLGRWKTQVARRIAHRNVCCSAHLAAQLGAPAVVIPNAYDEQTFCNRQPWVFRERDLAFVGRLVSDKGADVLLHALRRLHDRGLALRLSIIGQGPEETVLHHLAATLGLSKWVVFEGLKQGPELATLLNHHRVLVVPSVWPEPFGIVALEGLACGCVVVASDVGGLPEALGGLGALFPPGDAGALADVLARIWERPFDFLPPAERVAAHLSAHTRSTVAERYVAVLSEIRG
ncbi:MAG: glycosyltransferase family 4 protein [Saprospiraceae bacterium]|nr:glycosyltransferase family 4 protein [Saprospiraceae bacterium]MDW8229528.1 glycosyltransferase family 4 protein [Saprospiraceae bacterium]